MSDRYTLSDARDALQHCNPGTDRRQWVCILAGAKAAGLDFEEVLSWSATAPNFKNERDVLTAWNGISADGGIGAGTLFFEARNAGWRPSTAGKKLSPEEEALRRQHAADAARKMSQEAEATKQRQQQAAERAAEIYDAAGPVPADGHPYLASKGVKAHDGLRIKAGPHRFPSDEYQEVSNCLVIPIRSGPERIATLQFIAPDGRKVLLKDGAKSGCAFRIGTTTRIDDRPLILLAEGYATAASVHEATGYQTLCCVDAGNLLNVATKMRQARPDAIILLVADNDSGTPGNPGVAAATKASEAVLGSLVVVPPPGMDANDWVKNEGPEPLRAAVQACINSMTKVNDTTDADMNDFDTSGMPEPDGALPDLPDDLDGGKWPAGNSLIGAAALLPHADARDGTDTTHPLTQQGNALRMLDMLGDNLRYVPEEKQWLAWNDGRWSWVDREQVQALTQLLPEVIYGEGSSNVQDGELFAKWARESGKLHNQRAVVEMMMGSSRVRLKAAELDADPMLCGLDGGRSVLDLSTGKVRPVERGDNITKSLAVAELGESSKAVLWTKFMREVTCNDVELSDWLQRFLGYGLTGLNVEQFFVFMFGHGSNGKSTLIETVLKLMGGYGSTIQPATLCDDKRTGAGPSPDLANLHGVRFAVAAEAEEGSRFAESMLKGLVSGDTIQVRKLHCAPFDMKPVLKLALTGNHKPHISGTDRGVWRRVRLVPFAASFEAAPDKKLPEKLRAEFPHILAWLVDGCLAWQDRTLSDTPKAIVVATEAYRSDSDTLGHWLDERCTRGPNGEEKVADLYKDYAEWAKANGITRPWISRVFSQKLGEYRLNGWEIGERRSLASRYRTGISLRELQPL